MPCEIVSKNTLPLLRYITCTSLIECSFHWECETTLIVQIAERVRGIVGRVRVRAFSSKFDVSYTYIHVTSQLGSYKPMSLPVSVSNRPIPHVLSIDGQSVADWKLQLFSQIFFIESAEKCVSSIISKPWKPFFHAFVTRSESVPKSSNSESIRTETVCFVLAVTTKTNSTETFFIINQSIQAKNY